MVKKQQKKTVNIEKKFTLHLGKSCSRIKIRVRSGIMVYFTCVWCIIIARLIRLGRELRLYLALKSSKVFAAICCVTNHLIACRLLQGQYRNFQKESCKFCVAY